DNAASPNPPFGALLTYYLHDDAPSGAKYVLTVADASGKQVRQLDASSKAGVHRTPWGLREGGAGPEGGRAAAAAPPADPESPDAPPAGRGGRGGRGGGGGFGGRGGPMVKAGSYTVTLGKLENGQVTPLAKPQMVEVVQ